jgi:hypothetical protein
MRRKYAGLNRDVSIIAFDLNAPRLNNHHYVSISDFRVLAATNKSHAEKRKKEIQN